MTKWTKPSDCKPGEAARLAALQRYDVLGTPPSEAFNRITRVVQSILNAPIVLVSLVDDRRQWVKAHRGIKLAIIRRENSFCRNVIQNAAPVIVEDGTKDHRFRDNPLVTDEPRIRFYVGVPLVTPDGYVIGTLCAMDRKPRTLSNEKLADLRDLADLVVDILEMQRFAATDGLTGLLTRRSFHMATEREMERAKRFKRPAALIAFDIDHFKSINDTYGHGAGDEVLRALAQSCKPVLRAIDLFARQGGEEFVILLPETGPTGAMEVAERLRRRIADTGIAYEDRTLEITSSFGVAIFGHMTDTIQDAFDRADDALYHAKNLGRNRVIFNGVDTGLSSVA